MSSEAQIAANRQNAQASTGPKTEAGKAKSSLNAVRTGLTGRTVLLPTEDAAAYESHVQNFKTRYAPATEEEKNLVQILADTEWRLLRIPALEMGIYAVGRLELASKFENEEDPQARAALLEAQIFLTYQRQLNNLSIQEGRLLKQRDKLVAELAELQKLRAQQTYASLRRAAELFEEARAENRAFSPAEFGFEFTIEQLERHLQAKKLGRGVYSSGLLPLKAA